MLQRPAGCVSFAPVALTDPEPPAAGRRGALRRAALAALLSAIFLLPALAATIFWDTALEEQAGQTTYHNDIAFGALFGQPLAVTDFDGDGFPDVALCPFNSDGGPDGSRLQAGQVNVFLEDGAIGGVRALASEPPERVVRIFGPHEGAFLGSRIAAGDVDRDGIGDLLVGADERERFIDEPGHGGTITLPGKGRAYLIRGQAGISGDIDLASPPPNVTTILGRDDGDYTGTWVGLADVNGDGKLDLLIGVPGGDGPGNAGPIDVGEGVIVYNPRAGFPRLIDLASPPRGVRVTTIHGIDPEDGFGGTIVGADFDGDGDDDLAIGSRLGTFVIAPTDGPDNSRPNGGEVRVIRGGRLPSSINLALGLPTGTTTLYGSTAEGSFGEEIVTRTFVIGERHTLAVGALYNDETWLVPADLAVSGREIDLASPPAGVVRILGSTGAFGFRGLSGDSVALGDLDGDGFGDLMVGAPLFIPPDDPRASAAGIVQVVYGQAVWPSLIDLDFPPPGVRVIDILAADADDMLGYSLASADVDLDGKDDAVPNAMGGDGVRNRVRDSGGAYVISGAALSARQP